MCPMPIDQRCSNAIITNNWQKNFSLYNVCNAHNNVMTHTKMANTFATEWLCQDIMTQESLHDCKNVCYFTCYYVTIGLTYIINLIFLSMNPQDAKRCASPCKMTLKSMYKKLVSPFNFLALFMSTVSSRRDISTPLKSRTVTDHPEQ